MIIYVFVSFSVVQIYDLSELGLVEMFSAGSPPGNVKRNLCLFAYVQLMFVYLFHSFSNTLSKILMEQKSTYIHTHMQTLLMLAKWVSQLNTITKYHTYVNGLGKYTLEVKFGILYMYLTAHDHSS